MFNYPRVSIITPSFNQGNFIENTIVSVLNQTYPNIEYIVIDGASTDNTIEIIKKYEKDSRMEWISEKDKGQTNAINKGFRMARGEILAYLNSDDLYDNNGVIEIVTKEFIDDQELKLLYGKCYYINEKGETIGEFQSKKFVYNNLLNYDPGIIPQPSAFFKRDIIKKIGYLDESLNWAMDYDLWLKIGKTYKVKYIPIILSRFRIHSKSKTVRTYYQQRWETLRISRKHGAVFFSPLFFKELYHGLKKLPGEYFQCKFL